MRIEPILSVLQGKCSNQSTYCVPQLVTNVVFLLCLINCRSCGYLSLLFVAMAEMLLKSMEKYQLEKEEVESKMETVMEEMEESRVAQRNQLYTFERQRVVDINRSDVQTMLLKQIIFVYSIQTDK